MKILHKIVEDIPAILQDLQILRLYRQQKVKVVFRKIRLNRFSKTITITL
jgi:hypothetical protein